MARLAKFSYMEACSLHALRLRKCRRVWVLEPCSVFLHEACLLKKLKGPLHGHKTGGLGLVHCYTYPVQRVDKKHHIVLLMTLVYLHGKHLFRVGYIKKKEDEKRILVHSSPTATMQNNHFYDTAMLQIARDREIICVWESISMN